MLNEIFISKCAENLSHFDIRNWPGFRKRNSRIVSIIIAQRFSESGPRIIGSTCSRELIWKHYAHEKCQIGIHGYRQFTCVVKGYVEDKSNTIRWTLPGDEFNAPSGEDPDALPLSVPSGKASCAPTALSRRSGCINAPRLQGSKTRREPFFSWASDTCRLPACALGVCSDALTLALAGSWRVSSAR